MAIKMLSKTKAKNTKINRKTKEKEGMMMDDVSGEDMLGRYNM